MNLCNSQACLCNTKSISAAGVRPFSVQMAQWSAWQRYPGQLGNKDHNRRCGPLLFRFCNSNKAVSITGAGRLSHSPGMPGRHYLASDHSKHSVIRLEIKICLRRIRKDGRGGHSVRRTLPGPCQQGRQMCGRCEGQYCPCCASPAHPAWGAAQVSPDRFCLNFQPMGTEEEEDLKG